MSNRTRYTLDEIQRNIFYQLPKFLLSEEFKGLNHSAMVLYSVLRDRHELSIKNGWANEKGEVYIYFSREELCKHLRLSENTVIKIMNALKKFKLVEEERQGLGRPNKIYLLTVKNLEYSQNLNICGSETVEFEVSRTANIEVLKPQSLRANDTDLKDLELNDIKSNLIKSSPPTPSVDNSIAGHIKTDRIRLDERATQTDESEEGQKKESFVPNVPTDQSIRHSEKPSPVRYSINQVTDIVKENIDYDYILMDNPHCGEILDGIVHVMASTITTEWKDGYISMGEERVPAEVVRSVFFKLNKDDIEYFIENFNRQTEPITKLQPYIRTSLYRNHGTNSLYWSNRVHVDMPHMAKPKVGHKRN